MYEPKHFGAYELLPEDFYRKYEHLNDKFWLMFDDRLLYTIDWLRDVYGPITLNDWYWGGQNQSRGWRHFNCETGAFLSQHKFGRAADCTFKNTSAGEVRQAIREDPYSGIFQHITCIEDDVDWLHLDMRNWDKSRNGLLIIKP